MNEPAEEQPDPATIKRPHKIPGPPIEPCPHCGAMLDGRDMGQHYDFIANRYTCEVKPAPSPQCECAVSDAWRCAVRRHLSTVSCPCPCHRRGRPEVKP